MIDTSHHRAVNRIHGSFGKRCVLLKLPRRRKDCVMDRFLVCLSRSVSRSIITTRHRHTKRMEHQGRRWYDCIWANKRWKSYQRTRINPLFCIRFVCVISNSLTKVTLAETNPCKAVAGPQSTRTSRALLCCPPFAGCGPQ